MERRTRRTRQGLVVGRSMDKTAKVLVEKVYSHPKYLKTIKSSNKFLVHDEKNETKIGDVVEIEETRPLSRLKYHRIVRILGQAKVKLKDLPKKKKKETKSDSPAV